MMLAVGLLVCWLAQKNRSGLSTYCRKSWIRLFKMGLPSLLTARINGRWVKIAHVVTRQLSAASVDAVAAVL